MLTYNKDDFDGTLDDILESVNKILNNTGEGYETIEDEEENKTKESME